MSDLDKILLTAFCTLIGGTFLFIINQILIKIFLEPLQNIRKTIQEVAYNLSYYASIVKNAPVADTNDINVAREEFRRLFAQLYSASASLPMYRFFSFLRCVPSKQNVKEAIRDLIRLSNTNKSTTFELLNEFYNSISQHLKIKLLD